MSSDEGLRILGELMSTPPEALPLMQHANRLAQLVELAQDVIEAGETDEHLRAMGEGPLANLFARLLSLIPDRTWVPLVCRALKPKIKDNPLIALFIEELAKKE